MVAELLAPALGPLHLDQITRRYVKDVAFAPNGGHRDEGEEADAGELAVWSRAFVVFLPPVHLALI